jgi:DNA ligase-1
MFRPLLAPGEDPLRYPNYFKELRYPLLCSPKYDGIRCLIKGGVALSRTGKMLPSYQVQEEFGKYEDFDGELIEGAIDSNVYNRTQSHVMSESKPGDLAFYVFDYTHPDYLYQPFFERLDILRRLNLIGHVRLVEQQLVEDEEELIEYENYCLTMGFEGIMMRSPISPYKNGRATWREGIIYKLKRFQEDEAQIIGFEEQYTNTNALEVDELGYAKRSYEKNGMVPADTLGKFIVKYKDQELVVAPGQFTHDERKFVWKFQDTFKYKYLKFRFMTYGMKDLPRFPRAVGFRDEMDFKE